MQWFRMYAEAVDDEKLRMLAFEDRWHFVALLCLKAGGTLDADSKTLERRLSIKLGLDPMALGEMKLRLVGVDLIGKNWQPRNWDKRQYVSDHSTERVRKHRQKLARDVTETPVKRFCNAPDTESDTDTESESERRDSSSFPNSIRQSSSLDSSGPKSDLKVVSETENVARINALSSSLAQRKKV